MTTFERLSIGISSLMLCFFVLLYIEVIDAMSIYNTDKMYADKERKEIIIAVNKNTESIKKLVTLIGKSYENYEKRMTKIEE